MTVQESAAQGTPSASILPTGFIADVPAGGLAESYEASGAKANYKKGSQPILGESFTSVWSERQITWASLPGSGVIGFDLNKLTLADFRVMRDHYQVNASLSVLSFMMHQLQWRIECDNKKIADFVTENIETIWTRLVRALSQAFWAGYSPNILQWENDVPGRRIVLSKVKDLLPEEAFVNWKLVDGWAPPNHTPAKIKVYDGIRILGGSWPIPVDNSLWYPLLSENGDMYGKKLLRPAFSSWFFSIIMHLFANRYFERFGEPTPIGRAPFDEQLTIDNKSATGRQVMMTALEGLRSRSAIVLPSDRTLLGTHPSYDYTIEYLESQMRGADWERYMMRLDEEISLALFTPLLMLRTADVGSYSLGTTHAQVYLQMLNALAGDWKENIDRYILGKMVDINFGEGAPRARIHFRKLGDERADMVKALLQQLIPAQMAKPDLVELGEIAGLTLTEIQQVTQPPTVPGQDPNNPNNPDPNAKGGKNDGAGGSTGQSKRKAASNNARSVVTAILRRLEPQVNKAWEGRILGEDFVPSLGYERQLEAAFVGSDIDAGGLHAQLTAYAAGFAGLEIRVPEVMQYIEKGMLTKIEELCKSGDSSGASEN